MGIMERALKKRNRKGRIQRIVLKTVATAGMLSIALCAPNAFRALGRFGFDKRKEMFAIENSRRRLVRLGLLEYNRGLLRITAKGTIKLRELERLDYHLKKPLLWDEKWRVLIFDIQEKRRPTRDKIRRTLRKVGFVRLQDSVWVYPHDCEDFVTLIKTDFHIGKDLLYLIVDKIENNDWLKKEFDL